MLEQCLIEFCAATLASLKSASLFNVAFASAADAEAQVALWNEKLEDKGIQLMILRRNRSANGCRALVYVYRRNQLAKVLQNPEVAEFLRNYGYEGIYSEILDSQRDSQMVAKALMRLQGRVSESADFPHEIGIFLDYPLGDVRGFIDNEGRNFKCVGCWKVYCDECASLKKFAQYRKCREVYRRLWQQGRSVLQLTVAA